VSLPEWLASQLEAAQAGDEPQQGAAYSAFQWDHGQGLVPVADAHNAADAERFLGRATGLVAPSTGGAR
jgi:hypothetical protein